MRGGTFLQMKEEKQTLQNRTRTHDTLNTFLFNGNSESRDKVKEYLEPAFGDHIEAKHMNHMTDRVLVAQPHGIRLDDAQRRIHRKQCARNSHHLGKFLSPYIGKIRADSSASSVVNPADSSKTSSLPLTLMFALAMILISLFIVSRFQFAIQCISLSVNTSVWATNIFVTVFFQLHYSQAAQRFLVLLRYILTDKRPITEAPENWRLRYKCVYFRIKLNCLSAI